VKVYQPSIIDQLAIMSNARNEELQAANALV